MNKFILPAILLAGIAAFAVFDASTRSSAQEAVGTDAVVNLNRNLTAIQAANGVAYQCIRDHNQCLKTIPNSTLWNTSAYDIEFQTCCLEVEACNIFASSVRGGIVGVQHLDAYVDAACPDDASSVAGPRRLARLEGIQASRQ